MLLALSELILFLLAIVWLELLILTAFADKLCLLLGGFGTTAFGFTNVDDDLLSNGGTDTAW
jgi:hypothetical protein